MSLVTNTITIEQKKYSDIDMNFTRNVGNNDVYTKKNEEAIKQSEPARRGVLRIRAT